MIANDNNELQNNPLGVHAESMRHYKSLLDKGWTKAALNKYIKEQLIKKRLHVHQLQRVNIENSSKHGLRHMADALPVEKQPRAHSLNTEEEFLDLGSRTANIATPSSDAETIIKLINIDSRFRHDLLNTNSNDFIITLNYTLRNVIRMRLHEIEIPNSWYTISETKRNNSIAVTVVNNDGSSTKHKFHIPDGNYDFATLKATLESSISDHDTVFSDIATMSININTGKIIISAINEVNQISLHLCESQAIMEAKKEDVDPAQMTNTLGWFLGFRKSDYGMNTVHAAESLFDITGTRYIYLSIDDNKTNLNDFVIGNLHTSYLNENVIARVTLPNEKYQVINNNTTNIDLKHTQTRFYPQPVKMDRLRIKILDEYGNLLDLNGMDVSLTLEFTLKTDMMPYLH